MEREELKTQVQSLVADLFDEKEEAEIRRKTEAELERAASTISDLTTSLEEKNTEFSELEEKVTANESRIQELESELEAAQKELETANEKLGDTEQALEDMKKDRTAVDRMAEIEDAGVVSSDREAQTAKVREMSDEDFASYKDELVSIRESVVAELAKAEEKEEAEEEKEEATEDTDAQAEEEAGEETAEEESEEEASEEEASEEEETASEDDETTTPAEITPGQAAMASLNMEYIPSDDLMSKYAKLGEAMAARFKKSDE